MPLLFRCGDIGDAGDAGVDGLRKMDAGADIAFFKSLKLASDPPVSILNASPFSVFRNACCLRLGEADGLRNELRCK